MHVAHAYRQRALAPPGAIGILLVLAGSLNTLADAGPHYKWKEGEVRYHVVEDSRIINLIELGVLELGNPFNGWGAILVEPCVTEQQTPSTLPCWPKDRQKQTQELVAMIAAETPEFRGPSTLLRAAQYLNRDIGTFRRAWIIGTNPLIVAYLDGPADQVPEDLKLRMDQMREKLTLRPTTRPGFFEVVVRSGEIVPVDHRVRDSRFVTDADLEAQVDRVLLYPKDMPFLSAGVRPAPGVDPPHRVKVLHLAKPQSVESIMRALTKPGQLEREAKKVREVPVLLHP